MLKRIRIKGYKSLVDLELKLEALKEKTCFLY